MNSLFPTTPYDFHFDKCFAIDIAKSVWFKYIVMLESGYIPYEFNTMPSLSHLIYAIIGTLS